MAVKIPELDKGYIEDKLQQEGLIHLKVAKRGASISVYSEDEDGGRDNRCRFTYVKTGQYILNMANNSGKWESTPFEGTLKELLDMVLKQFPWMITDYSEENN